MLTIRLKRKGKKNQPFFRIVVTDKRKAAKGGRAIDVLGYFDPLTKRKSLNKERVLHWIKMGAKPSDTIHNMLVSEKIIDGKKIHVAKKSKKAPEAVVTPVVPAVSSDAKALADKPTETPAPEAVAASASASADAKAKADKKATVDKPAEEKPIEKKLTQSL